MSGSNPFVNPSVIQPANPFTTVNEYNNLLAAKQQQALYPGQQQEQQLAIQQGQLANQGAKLGITQKQNSIAAGYTRGLLGQSSIASNDILGAIGQAHAAGIDTSGLTADYASASSQPNFNPKAWIQQHLGNDMSAPDAVGYFQGSPTDVQTGPTLQPYVRGGMGGQAGGSLSPAGQPVTLGLSPGEAATPTAIGIDPKTKAPIMGTLGQFQTAAGADPFGTGRPIPQPLRGPNAAAPGVVTQAGPAQQSAASTTGAQSAQGFKQIADQGTQAVGQNSILGTMLNDTKSFTPGPTWANDAKKWMVANGSLIGTGFSIDPKSVAANESFDKMAAQIADAQGAGSDARLAVNQHANPSSSLSPQGADLMIRTLQGNADYLAARAKLANAYPDKTDVNGFNTAIGQKLDPHVFQIERMQPDQKATFYKNLSAKDKITFQKNYTWAEANGLVGDQNAAQ